MIGVENTKGEGSLRFVEGRGVPAYPQKLAIPLDPFGIFCARTELHVNIVSSVDVDNENNINLRVLGWTGGVFVTDVERVTQIAQSYPLEKPSIPDLGEREKWLFGG